MNLSKESNLSSVEAFALLAHWCSARAKLSLILIDSWSSFKGTVRVLDPDLEFRLCVRFTWVLDGPDNTDESFGATLINPEMFKETPESETRPRSLVCRCESGLRFVLAEVPKDKDFKEFVLESLLEH